MEGDTGSALPLETETWREDEDDGDDGGEEGGGEDKIEDNEKGTEEDA